jgi:AraC-like DNA-binding protein
MGDDDVALDVGHRTDPVLGADLVFTVVEGGCSVRLQGPVTRRHTYPHVPGAEYVGLRFRPGTSESTLGAGLSGLCNEAIEARRFDRIDLDGVGDRLLAAHTLLERARVVADILGSVPAARMAPNMLVTEALRRFASCPARITDVAYDLGVSERSLQRTFAHHLGIRPKHAARLVRVSRLLKRLDVEPDPDLALIAVATGFFDQAHMTSEVGRILATTPAALVGERLQRNGSRESR